jgi:hypothetical protein
MCVILDIIYFGLSGQLIGYVVRTIPAVLGYGAGLAVLLGTFDYTGGKLTGYTKDPDMDEFDRKEYLRKNRRRPIQEVIDELGEGRGRHSHGFEEITIVLVSQRIPGIYGPGYDERRRERIRERYGLEVPDKPQSST